MRHTLFRSARIAAAALCVFCCLSIVMLFPACGDGEVAQTAAPATQGTTQTTQPSEPMNEPITELWPGWREASINAEAALMREPDGQGDIVYTAAAGQSGVAVGQSGDRLLINIGAYEGWVEGGSVLLDEELHPFSAAGTAEPLALPGEQDVQKLDAIASRYGCTAATVAIIENGAVRYTYEYGVSDKAAGTPMTADTKLRVASLSKLFIALSAMSMQETGQLSLDADVGEITGYEVRNPRFPDVPLTIRQFLIHTTSLNEEFGYDGALPDLLAQRSSYLNKQPGTKSAFLYSNSASSVGGALLELAGGMTLADYTDRWLLDRMGLDASYVASRVSDPALIATLYDGKGRVTMSVEEQLGMTYSTVPGENRWLHVGWMTISARDMAKVLCMLINDGQLDGRYYLSPESVAALETVQLTPDVFDQCLILRRRTDSFGGRTLYYHTGNAQGVLSHLCYDPESGDGMVIMTIGSKKQTKSGGAYSVCADVARYCFENVIDKY